MSDEVKKHPVQKSRKYPSERTYAPQCVTMRAYEVYKHIYGEQEALVTGGCRGGFGLGELAAFLYARSFPRDEWRSRFSEGLKGMDL